MKRDTAYLTSKIYHGQVFRSRRDGRPEPTYTLGEFRNWFYAQPNHKQLYDNWVNSGYNTTLVPSVNRIDNSKPYTLDNIELVTWGENDALGHRDMRDCKVIHGNNPQKSVTATHIESSTVIEFDSMSQSSRGLGINLSNICSCCRGRLKSTCGYKFNYKKG